MHQESQMKTFVDEDARSQFFHPSVVAFLTLFIVPHFNNKFKTGILRHFMSGCAKQSNIFKKSLILFLISVTIDSP